MTQREEKESCGQNGKMIARYVRCLSKTKPGQPLYRVPNRQEYTVSATPRGQFEGLSIGVLDPWDNWLQYGRRKSCGWILLARFQDSLPTNLASEGKEKP